MDCIMRQKYEGKPRLFGAESAEEYGMARDNFASSIARWLFGGSSNAQKLNELKEQHDYEFSQPKRDADALLAEAEIELDT